MKRFLAAAVFVAASTPAIAAHAEETPSSTKPDAASPPVVAPSPAPATPSSAAAPAVAPAPEFTPDPDALPVEHWYGWQPLLFDAAAAAQAAIAYGINENALYATAAFTYVLGPVGVHMWHGRAGNIAASAGVRIASPGIGAIAGFAVDKAIKGSDGGSGAALGVGIGCVVAAVIDDVFISTEMLQFWERQSRLMIAPTYARDNRGLVLSGEF